MSAEASLTNTPLNTLKKEAKAALIKAIAAAPKLSERKPWKHGDEIPDGLPYTPFYGKKRGVSWCEKASDKEGIRLNWVCRYPQDAEHKVDDTVAGDAIEEALSSLAKKCHFPYVWIIHGPKNPTPNIGLRVPGSSASSEPTTPEWSVGACFGSDEKTVQVYGNIFITVTEEKHRLINMMELTRPAASPAAAAWTCTSPTTTCPSPLRRARRSTATRRRTMRLPLSRPPPARW